jgi:hypothetical protein
MKINVNMENSKVVNGKLFITGMKLSKLSNSLTEFITRGNTITHPTLGKMFEYSGPYSRS